MGKTAAVPDFGARYEADLFPFVERPSRYINHEINAVVKDWATTPVRIVLVFPDTYELGISHLGLKILYQVLNALPGVLAERCYAPWFDAAQVLRDQNLPLCSLESCRPLSEFHVVGFSIQYELCYTNVLHVLDLAGMPLRAAQRRGTPHPLILAGGNVFSPGPLEPFMDAFALGDGEEVVVALAHWVAQQVDGTRQFLLTEELLRDLAQHVPAIYVPELYEHAPARDPAGRLAPLRARHAATPFPVRKAWVRDLAALPPADQLLVPFCEAVHDRAQVEIMRGCVRGCRFCQAGMITRPQREKNAGQIVRETIDVINNTGFEEVTLASLSAGDCRALPQALRELFDPQVLGAARTAVSLPSLRIDSFDPALAESIRKMRKTGFTFAPEAGSERLRRVINKGLTDAEILETVASVFHAGWQLVKLYFMLGLPTETMDDIDALVRLVRQIHGVCSRVKGRAARINLSIATFVPKAFTPFQWAAFADDADICEKQQFILHNLPRSVAVDFHDRRISRLEAIFARGDARLADVVERAYQLGCRFDQWREQCKFDVWEQALCECGVDVAAYLAAMPDDSPLPWDALECGVTKEYLRAEWHKALATEATPTCRDGACNACGLQRWGKCN